MLEKLLKIASIGGIVSSLAVTRRFVVCFATIVALAVVAAVVAAALIVFGIYEGDESFVRHGVDPDMAALYAFLIGLAILAIVVGCIVCKIRRLPMMPVALTSSGPNMIANSAMAVAQGFWRGLTAKREPKTPYNPYPTESP